MLGKCSTTQLHTEKCILTNRKSIKSNPRHQLTLGCRQVYTISHRMKGSTYATEGSAPLLPCLVWWSQRKESGFGTSSIRTTYCLLVNDIPLSLQILEPGERWTREDRQMGIKKKVGIMINETDEETWL